MNFLPQLLTAPSLLLILTFIAFLISWVCAYQLFRATILAKKMQLQLGHAENRLACLEQTLDIHNILNLALINSSQTKNNIELCNLLLDACVHKSDILTAKALENTLHTEINNAVIAIESLEEKRSFLETKIREAFETVKQKTLATEIEPCLPYVQVLLEESNLEFASTERMKQDVLKVNRVLDRVLLKV